MFFNFIGAKKLATITIEKNGFGYEIYQSKSGLYYGMAASSTPKDEKSWIGSFCYKSLSDCMKIIENQISNLKNENRGKKC